MRKDGLSEQLPPYLPLASTISFYPICRVNHAQLSMHSVIIYEQRVAMITTLITLMAQHQ